MFFFDLLIAVFIGKLFTVLHCFYGFLGKFGNVHTQLPPYSIYHGFAIRLLQWNPPAAVTCSSEAITLHLNPTIAPAISHVKR